ncbi:MAG TPA: S-layer homology domain-containing protein [Chloroflexia bacterium]|nr:S-layer homology domain-containing protein [Chloroflexia bacterium]
MSKRGSITTFTILLLALACVAIGTSASARATSRSAAGPSGLSGPGAPHPPASCTPGWAIIPSANVPATNNYLNAVAVVATNDVWVAGNAGNATLTEHWDGTAWSTVPSPSVGTGANMLSGLAALASNNVWAVGRAQNSTTQTLIEHWDGTAWSIVPSPNAGTGNNLLGGVAAIAPNDIWAVGASQDGVQGGRTLTEHWDGTAWSVVASPDPGPDPDGVIAVSAVTSTNVWAVGAYYVGSNQYTLVEHWNGTSWAIVPNPNPAPGTGGNVLFALTALSASNIWAVGTYNPGSPIDTTLVEHWDGSAWSIVPSPNDPDPTHPFNVLDGVAAFAPNDIWATGFSAPNGQEQNRRPLALHWDGTTWQAVTTPSVPGATDGRLNGLVASAPNQLWAVGFAGASGTSQTLVERYTGACSTDTPTATTGLPPATATSTPLPPTATNTPASCGLGWSIVASPNVPTGANYLNAFAAVAGDDAWAAGSAGNATLLEHWNGNQWSIVPSPNFGTGANVINGLVAHAANDIWAVGNYNDGSATQPLIEHWNGTAWAIVASPYPGSGNNTLTSVAALAADDVWAVGWAQGTSANSHTLVEHWNGAAWAIVASPSQGTLDDLAGVAVLSSTNAWAVGAYYVGYNQFTLTEHWDGTAWSIVPSPNPSPSIGGNALNGMAATSATDIWAVGSYNNGPYLDRTLIEHWDGTAWAIVASPNDPNPNHAFNALGKIATLGANNAWTVGYSAPDGQPANRQPLVEHWDGASWQVVVVPQAAGATDSWFGSVGFAGSDQLWTVGYDSANSPAQTLTERDITACSISTPTSTPVPPTATVPPCGPGWQLVASPNAGTGTNILDGVAVAGPNDAWAVGYAANANNVEQTLIEHWNGSTWDLVPSPNVGTNRNFLHAAAVAGPNDIWAVGFYWDASNVQRTLTEHWDGSAWSVVASPNAGSHEQYLQSVTALAPNDVWAVGLYSPDTYMYQTLTLHWNGSQWSVVASPNVGSLENYLNGVTATAGGDVWAVGYYSNYGAARQTLIEHWTGNAWQLVASPNAGTGNNVLNAASATGSADVWAVGTAGTGSAAQPLTEHWNGTSWTVVASASGGGSAELRGVVALAPGEAWAVGRQTDATGTIMGTLTEHWNGSSWAVVTSPNPDPSANILKGIAAGSAGDLWAVGTAANPGRTLVEHYIALCLPTATTTPGPPVATGTPEQGCQFAILSYHPCINPQGCVDYAIPLQNESDSAMTVDGTVIFQRRGGIEIGSATIPSTTLPPRSITMVTGTVCGIVQPKQGPFQLLVTVQDIPRVCEAKTKRQPVTFCAPPSTAPDFSDVPPAQPFAPFIAGLAGASALSGYACGGPNEPCNANNAPYFRPAAIVTRGQLLKLVVNAAGWPVVTPAVATFADVTPRNPFYDYIETGAAYGVISGYPCGRPGEPCNATHQPYFRPTQAVTRGQLVKIAALAEGFGAPATQTFQDAPPGSAFYSAVEAGTAWGIVGGYGCGAGPAGPCVAPGNRAYFLPNQPVTRGQAAKILAITFLPDGQIAQP